FQAEDGIRDYKVTGVQTCALPISSSGLLQLDNYEILTTDTVGFISRLPTYMIDAFKSTLEESLGADLILLLTDVSEDPRSIRIRSEERRVGKECRYRWGGYEEI